MSSNSGLTNFLQTQILKNFKAVLEAAGSGLGKVIKVNVYITDMRNFEAMNEAYQGVFENPQPVSPPLSLLAGLQRSRRVYEPAAVIDNNVRNRQGRAFRLWGSRFKRRSRWSARLCIDGKIVRMRRRP